MPKECIDYDLMGKCIKWKKDPDGTLVIKLDTKNPRCSKKDLEEAKRELVKQKIRVRIPGD